jgi:hypothetical protein
VLGCREGVEVRRDIPRLNSAVFKPVRVSKTLIIVPFSEDVAILVPKEFIVIRVIWVAWAVMV